MHGVGRDSHREHFKKFEVVSVELVQNPQIWKRYAAARSNAEDTLHRLGSACPTPLMDRYQPPKEFREPLLKACNEYYLFHGTKGGVVGLVAEQGFDSRLGGGMFGQGSYFVRG